MLKRSALIVFKLSLAGGLIYWLYREQWLDFSPLLALRFTAEVWGYLLLAVSFFFLGLIMMSWRLLLLLRNRQFSVVPFRDVVQITCASSLTGTLFPGMVGADVLKVVFFCSKMKERRLDAFVIVVFDRLIGLYGLFLLATLTSVFAWFSAATQVPSAILIIAPSVWLFVTSVGLLVRSEKIFRTRPVQALYLRMPQRVQRLIDASRSILQANRLLAVTTLISLFNHSCTVIAFMCAAWMLADPLSALLHFVLTPLAVFMNAVPITPGGLGLTESAFAFLFQIAGSENGALIALLGRILLYTVFLVSGLISLIFLRWHGYPMEALQQDNESQA